MGIQANAQVELKWPQQQQVPLGGGYNVYANDGEGGAVDYNSPLNASVIPAWPDGDGKIGDGLGADGLGADGWGHGGAGDGLGADGLGMDGFGANWQSWRTQELADGNWDLAVVGVDAAGNVVTPADIELTATVAGTPRGPAADPVPTAYAAGTLSVNFSMSPDDEAF